MHRFFGNKHFGTVISLFALIVLGVVACRPRDKADNLPPTDQPATTSQAELVLTPRGRTARPTLPVDENQVPAGPSGIDLTDVVDETGITFVHTDGSSGKHYLMETMSAGIATFDFDRDGLIDIYFLNGAPLPDSKSDVQPTNALYRNLGNWKFADVTQQAGVGDTNFGLGVTTGDYNNDGFADLYLSNFGPNVIYRNNGDGTFTDVTDHSGVGNGNQVGAGVCFLDVECDGDLDLYVSNYVQFSYEAHQPKIIRGHHFYPGPLDHQPAADTLYRNNGDGTFTNISRSSGIAAHHGTGMGITSGDFDGDGDTDVFVANDEMANALLENDGHGNFQETAVLAGVAYDLTGVPQASMGVDCGDYDNDGKLDFYVTSYENEFSSLYRNLGNGFFYDVTRLSGAAQGTLPHVTWGNGFVDFDHDGDRDLYIACGHTEDNIEAISASGSYKARNILLMNTGDQPRFVNVSQSSGSGMLVKRASRGTAFDDLDNDGDVDVVVLNSRDKPTLLRNDTDNRNHWLQIRLIGVTTNREAVGSQVTVAAGDLVLMDEVHSGRGYQSHWGNRLDFGLGQQGTVDRITVRWLGGGTDEISNIDADQIITIVQRLAD